MKQDKCVLLFNGKPVTMADRLSRGMGYLGNEQVTLYMQDSAERWIQYAEMTWQEREGQGVSISVYFPSEIVAQADPDGRIHGLSTQCVKQGTPKRMRKHQNDDEPTLYAGTKKGVRYE